MNHTGLFLSPSLFYYTPVKVINYCWNYKYKNIFNQTLTDEYEDNLIENIVDKQTEIYDKQTDDCKDSLLTGEYKNSLTTDDVKDSSFNKPTDDQTKFVFGILNEHVWKSKFDEKMTKTKVIECDDDDKKTYKHLNVHSFNLYSMDTVFTLFQEATITELTQDGQTRIELTGNLIKWKIYENNDDYKINLEVFKKINTKWELINTRNEYYPYRPDYKYFHKLIAGSIFNNNDIVILTTFGILIYTFSENNKSISLNYFYFMKIDVRLYIHHARHRSKYKKRKLQHYKRIFSKSTLPLPNYDSFGLDSWVLDIKNNKLSLLKYGVELLTFAIKEHNLELIDYIYEKCMTYFKEDLMNNKSFLSIITSTMPLLDEYYPEYILKYSSETNMIIDSSFYSIEHQNKNLHLYSFFQSPQIDNLSQSLLWTKCCYKGFCSIDKTFNKENLFSILMYFLLFIIYLIQVLIIFLILPLYLATFYILSKYKFINNIYTPEAFSSVYFTAELFIFKKKHNNTNNYFYGSLY
jgi:hypothetical protein